MQTEPPKHPNAPGRLAAVRDFLALERNVAVLVGAVLIIGMGEQLWACFVPKYLQWLGATAMLIGLFGTLEAWLDAIYQYPGGVISDRLGRKRSLVLFNLLAIIGYALYAVGLHWACVFLGVLFVMAWGSLSLPATFALIGDNLPQSKRAMGFSVQSILKRAPHIVAPIVGGILLQRYGVGTGMRIGLLVTIVLAIVTLWIQQHMYREKPREQPPQGMSLWHSFLVLSPSLKRLLIADILCRVGQGVAKVFIVIYATGVVGVTEAQFGSLVSLQMTVSILTYIPMARLADRYGRRPFVLAAFALFAAYPLAIGLSPSYLALLFAFAVAGSRELGEPARKALIVDLAHPDRRGRDVGVYYLVRGLCVTPAPLLGGLLYGLQPRLTFAAATGIATLGLLWFAFGFKMPEAKAKDASVESGG